MKTPIRWKTFGASASGPGWEMWVEFEGYGSEPENGEPWVWVVVVGDNQEERNPAQSMAAAKRSAKTWLRSLGR